MSVANRYRSNPGLESLEERGLMAAGVSASLSHGILTVVGQSVNAPIVLDVNALPSKHGVQGAVVVEGVASFQANQVKKVVIDFFNGESVKVNRAPKWNPQIQLVAMKAPATAPPVSTPTPTTPPTTTPKPVVTPTGNPPVTSTESATEQAIVNAVNAIRTSKGIAPLNVDGRLVAAAQIQARAMANYGVLGHTVPQAAHPSLTDRLAYVGYDFVTLSENLASGNPDTTSLMSFWTYWPSFNANVIGTDHTDIGVGVAFASDGTPYYCMVVASPA